METIIEILEGTKLYGRKRALDEVSLTIGPGITGLLGPNGSGKSTLIKSLLGLVALTRGRAWVLGCSMPDQRRTIHDRVGFLPEDDCFLAGLSGIESVHTMARLSGLPYAEGLRRAHEVLDYADVGQERYRAVETYSTGMRQKLKFAQALVHDPQLIIMDEPTNGLDPYQRSSMLQRIVDLARTHGKSILLSTHILLDVRVTCESVVILANGTVRLQDTMERLNRPTRPGMQVTLLEEASGFVDALQRRSMASEKLADGSVWVDGIGPEATSQLWRTADECGVSIVQLQPARNSLEQVFLDAVRGVNH